MLTETPPPPSPCEDLVQADQVCLAVICIFLTTSFVVKTVKG